MSEPAGRVTVTAGARLHFGLCSLSPLWGGAGVMVEEPATRVAAVRAAVASVHAPTPILEKARSAVEAVRPPGVGVRVEVHACPVPHAGFGSGTQVSLAVATAVTRLLDLPDPDPATLAGKLDRGGRSRLGTAGFRSGGLLLDPLGAAGAARGDGVRSVQLPADWRWVVVSPRNAAGKVAGVISGGAEADALASLSMPLSQSGGLRRMVEMAFPLAAGGEEEPPDARLLARIIGDYGTRVGGVFAGVQGGVFAADPVRAWAEDRAIRGLPAPAQSSWGPTACTLAADPAEAAAEVMRARTLLGDTANVFATPTRNRGADVRAG